MLFLGQLFRLLLPLLLRPFLPLYTLHSFELSLTIACCLLDLGLLGFLKLFKLLLLLLFPLVVRLNGCEFGQVKAKKSFFLSFFLSLSHTRSYSCKRNNAFVVQSFLSTYSRFLPTSHREPQPPWPLLLQRYLNQKRQPDGLCRSD